MRNHKFGDRVRVRAGATGRYFGRYEGVDVALVVSAQDNDLFVSVVDPDGDPPHPTLPAPSDEALAAAAAGARFGLRLMHTHPNPASGAES